MDVDFVGQGELLARQFSVMGEDTPTWVTSGAAALGLALAGVAGYLALADFPLESARAPVMAEQGVSRPVAEATAPPEPLAATHLRAAASPHPSLLPLPEALVSLTRPAASATLAPAEARAVAPSHAAEKSCLPVVAIPFDENSAKPMLSGPVKEQVAPLMAWLKDKPRARLSVEGHGDSRGEEGHNLLLSYRRAQAVAAWVESLGAPPQRVTARAAGSGAAADPATVADVGVALVEVEGVEACEAGGELGAGEARPTL